MPEHRREHRRKPRIDDPTIDVKGAWSAVYNLSAGGMCVVTMEPIGLGAKRTFELVERRTGKSRTLTGQVVWAVPVSEGIRRLGIEWLEMDPEAREWLTRQLGVS